MERGLLIAYHRKRLNLTQTELGEKVNVTAQAVSKWEKGISEPDLSTIQKLCKIFEIDVSEFFAEEPEGEEATVLEEESGHTEEGTAAASAAEPPASPAEPEPAPETAPAPEAVPVQPARPRVIVGYCDNCKRPVDQSEKYGVYHRGPSAVQYILCRNCDRQKKIREASSEVSSQRKRFLLGMIVGGAVGIVLALIFVITTISEKDPSLLSGLLVAACGFTFASQLFWDGVVVDIMGFFLRSFRMPGLIFTLDLDGILWFITVKLTLMILSGILSVLWFLIGVVFTLIASLFIFPFAIVKNRTEFAKAKNTLKIYTDR